jgi:hypothetical protein
MKHILICLLTLSFSLQSIAVNMPKNSISSVMTKYDYLLTAHPQAHETEFSANTLKAMKSELAQMASSMTKEELSLELEVLLKQVPTIEQRVSFTKLLETATPEQISSFFANPKLLEAALRGQGANFAMDWDEYGAVMVLGALVLALVVAVIVQAIKDSRYQFFTAWNGSQCASLSASVKADLLEEAKNKCLSGATHPETCEKSRFGDKTSWQTSPYGDEYEDTDCEAEYRAKKKLD